MLGLNNREQHSRQNFKGSVEFGTFEFGFGLEKVRISNTLYHHYEHTNLNKKFVKTEVGQVEETWKLCCLSNVEGKKTRRFFD